MENTIDKMSVNNMIAFCYARTSSDDYFYFEGNLAAYLINNSIDNFEKINDISNKKRVLFNKPLKDFYDENRGVINTINNFTNIYDFVMENYLIEDNKVSRKDSFDSFYKYLIENSSKREDIIKTLRQFQKLGISDVYFDRRFSFENTSFENVFCYNEFIEYTYTSPNYIIIAAAGSDMTPFNKSVAVNNLLFDYKKIPNINEDTIERFVRKLKENEEKELLKLKTIDNLSLELNELEEIIQKLNVTKDNVNNMHKRVDFSKNLSAMSMLLKNMRNITNLYEDEEIEKNKMLIKVQN